MGRANRNNQAMLEGKSHITEKIELSLEYAVIIMMSLCSNSLLCQVFMKQKEINKSTGLPILNLAISNILIILLNSPFVLLSDYRGLVPAYRANAAPVQGIVMGLRERRDINPSQGPIL